jgi:S1-C subfamily serine protease
MYKGWSLQTLATASPRHMDESVLWRTSFGGHSASGYFFVMKKKEHKREWKPFFLLSVFYFLFSFCIFSQTLPENTLDRVKKATVFINVKHNFVLTDDDLNSSGSGFFISEKGWIATNYHVIQSSFMDYSGVYPTRIKQIKIIRNSGTSDYKTYSATIVSVDKENDLAILAIDDTAKFPFLEMDTLEPKELTPVWIFGYPFGEEFTVLQRGPEITVSNGSISALRHDDRNELNHIQVDAVINHGNSGGPVVNEKGKVVGVINSMFGSSRINFAVPSHYLGKMLMKIPTNFHISDSTLVTLKLTPPDALLFVDYKNVTDKISHGEFFLPNGLHTFITMKSGYESLIKEISLTGGKYNDTLTLAAEKTFLVPQVNTKIQEAKDTRKERYKGENTDTISHIPTIPPLPSDVLLKENFDDNKKFETWEQNTGGEKRRTWYLEDGKLYQYENNGTLHAIYIGDKSWDNYTIRSRVKISDEGGQKESDSRAGIIFRQNDDGFYLLRIHKESNKMQLAYHSNNPFGWFIITEKKLDEDIVPDKWYYIAASVHGNTISCFLNDKKIFTVYASYASKGRVGFYSVESIPAFDSLTVVRTSLTEISNPDQQKNTAQPPSLVSFWFSDNFDLKSILWEQYRITEIGEKELFPFYMVDGAFAITDEKNFFQNMEFTRYLLQDFMLSVSLSVAQGKEYATLEIFLRKEDENKLLIRFDKSNSKLILALQENGKEKILKENKIPSQVFGSHITLNIKADGNKIAVGSMYSANDWLNYESSKIPLRAGRIGFAAKGVRVAFHGLTISSITEQPETK